jgi:phosphoglycolate phosphatase-like HAD superfamily hydrolase
MDFVKANGGLSRYGKIRYLYNDILGQPLSEEQVHALAGQYSELVAERIIAADAVPGSVEFLDGHADRFEFAVVSGSDQNELRRVCGERGIDGYFRAILGSPQEKTENLVELLSAQAWDRQACLYVGDSLNDRDAAAEAGIGFIGRASGLVDWKDHDEVWILDLHGLPAAIGELTRRQDEDVQPESTRSNA